MYVSVLELFMSFFFQSIVTILCKNFLVNLTQFHIQESQFEKANINISPVAQYIENEFFVTGPILINMVIFGFDAYMEHKYKAILQKVCFRILTIQYPTNPIQYWLKYIGIKMFDQCCNFIYLSKKKLLCNNLCRMPYFFNIYTT